MKKADVQPFHTLSVQISYSLTQCRTVEKIIVDPVSSLMTINLILLKMEIFVMKTFIVD